MALAFELASRAEKQGEVPVGAVIVHDGEVIMALREAGRAQSNHRLPACDLYVTLEPCAMCVGAMIHARIQRVVFGAADPKTGALGGNYDLQELSAHNHRLEVSGGILSDEAAEMLRSFFRRRRVQGDNGRS